MGRKLKTILFTLIIVLLGFLREYLFVNINWIYLTLVNNRMNSAREEFYFLLDWSPNQINILKFCLTALFTLLFFGLTYLIIRIHFKNRQFNKIVVYVFLTILLLAGALLVFGKLSGTYTTIYGAIRTLMGIAQSFMPLMILGLVFRFLPLANHR